jgi:uncharacterized protein YcbK (DUF882 family)
VAEPREYRKRSSNAASEPRPFNPGVVGSARQGHSWLDQMHSCRLFPGHFLVIGTWLDLRSVTAMRSTGRTLRRRLSLAVLFLVALAVSVVAPSSAEAGRKRSSDKGTTKVCSTKKGAKGKKAKRCRREKTFSGHGVAKDKLRVEPLERPSGAIELYAENLAEGVTVNLYKEDGTFDDASLAALDELFRCKRTDETRAVRPELYEMLSRIYDHFGQKRVSLVSGFRFAERDSSRHFHASAMDIRIEGVSAREIYEYAESLDAGGLGIGIYPHSGFVHVDFRAPGEPSYRWRDLSGPNSGKSKGKKAKDKRRTTRATKPVS